MFKETYYWIYTHFSLNHDIMMGECGAHLSVFSTCAWLALQHNHRKKLKACDIGATDSQCPTSATVGFPEGLPEIGISGAENQLPNATLKPPRKRRPAIKGLSSCFKHVVFFCSSWKMGIHEDSHLDN